MKMIIVLTPGDIDKLLISFTASGQTKFTYSNDISQTAMRSLSSHRGRWRAVFVALEKKQKKNKKKQREINKTAKGKS